MLTTCHAQNKDDVIAATSMIHNYYKNSHFVVELWANIVDGAYHVEEVDTIEKTWALVDTHLSEIHDNVGIYFNSGNKIFVKIYKHARHNHEAYRDAGPIPLDGPANMGE